MKMQSTLRVFFKKYSLLLGILYLLPYSLVGQEIYNQTFEFDHWQQNGQNVIELDSFYYVSGNLLEKEIPDNFELGNLKSLMNSSKLEIELFTDKVKAAKFLSKPIKK